MSFLAEQGGLLLRPRCDCCPLIERKRTLMKKQLLAALVMAGLSSAALAQTVATVNGTKIDSKEVDAQVQMMVSESQGQLQDSPQLRDTITKRLITRTLMIQEARRLKIDQDPQFKAALDQALAEAKRAGDDKKPSFKQDWATFQENLLTHAFLSAVVGSNPVTKEETQAAYKDLSNYYKGSDEIQLGEIVTRTQADAERAINDLKARKSFKSVASQYTIDPAGKAAGGIPKGYVALKDLEQSAPPLYAAVRDLKKGQYTTTPLQGNGIFAVFYINDRRAVRVPSFEQMEAQLVQRLQEARVEAAIDQLYKKATIK